MRLRRFWVHPIAALRMTRGVYSTLYMEWRGYPEKFFNYIRMKTLTSWLHVLETSSVDMTRIAASPISGGASDGYSPIPCNWRIPFLTSFPIPTRDFHHIGDCRTVYMRSISHNGEVARHC